MRARRETRGCRREPRTARPAAGLWRQPCGARYSNSTTNPAVRASPCSGRRFAWRCGLGPARIANPSGRISTSRSSSVSGRHSARSLPATPRIAFARSAGSRAVDAFRRRLELGKLLGATRIKRVAQRVGPKSPAFPPLVRLHLLQRPEALLDWNREGVRPFSCLRRVRSPCLHVVDREPRPRALKADGQAHDLRHRPTAARRRGLTRGGIRLR